MAGLRRLKLETRPVPLAPALDALRELSSIPGRKTVLLWSDFRWDGPDTDTLGALGRLKEQYGGQADILVIYGDSDDRGWQLAENLAKIGSPEAAWNGCLLLADQSYFQRFIRRVLSSQP
jgi:hypothetical protein